MTLRKIIRFLSSPAVSIAVILIAVAGRIFLQIHFLNTDNDKSYQLQAAKNFFEGNGFTLLEAFNSNISQSSFVPLTKWPPGYSFFVSPFLAVTNNLITASLLLDGLTSLLFIVFSRRILTRLQVPLWLLNIYTLTTGIFLYSFCTASSSDFLALIFIIISLDLSLSIVPHKQLQPGKIVLLSLLIFFAAFTRYMYIPFVVCLPSYFIITGFFTKKNNLIRKGFFSFCILAALTGSLLLYQFYISGSATYIRYTGKGFFPETLLETQPFLFSSFFNVSFATEQISRVTVLSYENISHILQTFHCLVIILGLSLLIKYIRKFLINPLPVFNNYMLIGLMFSSIVIVLLVYLSITNAPFETGEKHKWTYLHETRYFAFPIYFFQQLLFVAIYRYKQLSQKLIRILITIMIILFSFDFLHNVYYTTKALSTIRQSVYKYPDSQGLVKFINNLVTEIRKKNSGKKIIFYSNPVFIGSQAGFYHPVAALYNWKNSKDWEIHTKEEVFIIYITTDPETLPKSLKNGHMQSKLQFDEYYFFIINLFPDKK